MPKNEVKSLTVKLSSEVYKRLVQFCKIDNDISHQDFAENAIIYCLDRKILPGEKKK